VTWQRACFSRDVIAAILEDINKRFLTSFFCLCHPTSPPGLCHLNLPGLISNHQYAGKNQVSLINTVEALVNGHPWTKKGLLLCHTTIGT